jgi:hypothetical protein
MWTTDGLNPRQQIDTIPWERQYYRTGERALISRDHWRRATKFSHQQNQKRHNDEQTGRWYPSKRRMLVKLWDEGSFYGSSQSRDGHSAWARFNRVTEDIAWWERVYVYKGLL